MWPAWATLRSTLLDLLLGTAKKALSWGKISDRASRIPQKAGRASAAAEPRRAECRFWAPVLNRLAANGSELSEVKNINSCSRKLAHSIVHIFQSVNSSKQVANLRVLQTLPEVEISVLHNIKDVRAFTTSMIDNELRKHNRRPSPEKLFLEWYRTNCSVHSQINQVLGRPPLRVMYEALCFATQTVAERVTEVLGEQYIDPCAPLKSGLTHIISGNRFRLWDSTEATSPPMIIGGSIDLSGCGRIS